eukprot:scaffold2255_cov259-Pinguiococcus_pyrenoidosus.AAC.1
MGRPEVHSRDGLGRQHPSHRRLHRDPTHAHRHVAVGHDPAAVEALQQELGRFAALLRVGLGRLGQLGVWPATHQRQRLGRIRLHVLGEALGRLLAAQLHLLVAVASLARTAALEEPVLLQQLRGQKALVARDILALVSGVALVKDLRRRARRVRGLRPHEIHVALQRFQTRQEGHHAPGGAVLASAVLATAVAPAVAHGASSPAVAAAVAIVWTGMGEVRRIQGRMLPLELTALRSERVAPMPTAAVDLQVRHHTRAAAQGKLGLREELSCSPPRVGRLRKSRLLKRRSMPGTMVPARSAAQAGRQQLCSVRVPH